MEKIGELGIHLPSLVVYLVNFLLLVVLLYLVGYKPILRMLDERSARIREGLEQAERLKEETARGGEALQARLAEARKEAQALIDQAAQAGERMREEARQQARVEGEALIERARGEIQRERDEVLEELRRQFADLAITAAERVIQQSLDKTAHRRLIEQVLKESQG